MFDLQILAVHQGYWAGYYSKARKPKSLETLLNKMIRSKNKSERSASAQPITEEVDVEKFLEREKRRLSQIKV